MNDVGRLRSGRSWQPEAHKFLTLSPTHRRDPESRWVCRAMPVGRGGGWVQHPLAGTKVKREAGGEESQHEPHGLEGASVDRSLANWQAMLEHKTSRELRNLCPPTHRAALAWAPHKFLTLSPTHRHDSESRWVCRAMPTQCHNMARYMKPNAKHVQCNVWAACFAQASHWSCQRQSPGTRNLYEPRLLHRNRAPAGPHKAGRRPGLSTAQRYATVQRWRLTASSPQCDHA